MNFVSGDFSSGALFPRGKRHVTNCFFFPGDVFSGLPLFLGIKYHMPFNFLPDTKKSIITKLVFDSLLFIKG